VVHFRIIALEYIIAKRQVAIHMLIRLILILRFIMQTCCVSHELNELYFNSVCKKVEISPDISTSSEQAITTNVTISTVQIDEEIEEDYCYNEHCKGLIKMNLFHQKIPFCIKAYFSTFNTCILYIYIY